MKILEKPFCNEEFFEVETLEDIKNSPNNATLVFKYCDSSLELFNFCKNNNIPYAVLTSNVKELIFCANLGAKYIFCDTIKNAKIFQKIADEYLLDSKIVLLIDSFNEIEKIVDFGIDAIKLKGKR
ncbi:conserved hypothetical protein [Nautilia profundicola AmH]|uniref:Uncharacterized protein n=1 Tax=Nautilia profundicola (strain ATCC BAA-1463 / DSM 18972 / AmH) TaxID=598659 RepID=B9L8J7_NAUPA|nr:hypothetical protein [Nautilia profundicola]ACM93466.1 conserved hypothetical protein [Nautilia profundicola AmH]